MESEFSSHRYSFGYDSIVTIPAGKDRTTEPFGYFLSPLENGEQKYQFCGHRESNPGPAIFGK